MTKQEYDRKRYLNTKKKERFKDRKCLVCESLLAGKYGANRTRLFCLSCKDTLSAKRIKRKRELARKKLYYQNNRTKRLAYQKQYDKKLLEL